MAVRKDYGWRKKKERTRCKRQTGRGRCRSDAFCRLPLLAAAKAVGLGLIFKVVQAFASVAISFNVVEACCVQALRAKGEERYLP